MLRNSYFLSAILTTEVKELIFNQKIVSVFNLKQYRPLSNLRHTTVKLAQLRMWVAKDELLPGIIHLESVDQVIIYLCSLDYRAWHKLFEALVLWTGTFTFHLSMHKSHLTPHGHSREDKPVWAFFLKYVLIVIPGEIMEINYILTILKYLCTIISTIFANIRRF